MVGETGKKIMISKNKKVAEISIEIPLTRSYMSAGRFVRNFGSPYLF